jgi:hypothetical protein
MFGYETPKIDPKKVLSLLEEYEAFCLGTKHLTPQQVKSVNEALSLGAMVHVGTCYFARQGDGRHMIWRAPDGTKHDLGVVEKINVFQDCPGFHRSRSLSLGEVHVESTAILDVPQSHKTISIVRMKDGSEGFGANYRLALRNAALKMHIKRSFNRISLSSLWKSIHGHA